MDGQPVSATSSKPCIDIRALQERDLSTADRIMRVAFGTFVGVPDPTTFMGVSDYVRTRWRTDPAAAFGAFNGEELVGSNFAVTWGSVGFFGPLTVRPDHWDGGVGRKLMEPVLDCFERRGVTLAGLFTFAASPKHAALYEKYGFQSRFLTPIMAKKVALPANPVPWTSFSEVPAGDRAGVLRDCRELTGRLYEGMDATIEINAVAAQGIGETVLLRDDAGLAGLAICHCGCGSEAGADTCFVKFGAARPGPNAARDFLRLIHACEDLARSRGLGRLVAGVNVARREAYRTMRQQGFRTEFQGVAMHRDDKPGFSRPGDFVMDDWR